MTIATSIDYLPLPPMPNHTHEPKTEKVQESEQRVLKRTLEYKWEDPYYYHPHDTVKRPREGQNVDFVVA